MKVYKITALGKLVLCILSVAVLLLVVSGVSWVVSALSPQPEDSGLPSDDLLSPSTPKAPMSSPPVSDKPSSSALPESSENPSETHTSPEEPSEAPATSEPTSIDKTLALSFSRDSYTLSDDIKAEISAFISPQDYLDGYCIVIEGCSYINENPDLALYRAQAVSGYMSSQGVPATSMYLLTRKIQPDTGEDALKVTVYYIESQLK